MKHLFSNWKNIKKLIEDSPHLLLLADYDGTLTPIVSRPKDAVLEGALRRTLKLLSKRKNFYVGVISGRKLADELGEELGAVLVGSGVGGMAQEAIAAGADKVYVVDDPQLEDYQTDSYVAVMEKASNQVMPQIILLGQNSVGRDLAGALPDSFTASKDKTHITGEDYVITWAIGHLVGLAEPASVT